MRLNESKLTESYIIRFRFSEEYLLRFENPPDTVFQAILRNSLDFVVDDIDAMPDVHQNDELLVKEDFNNTYQIMANVFTPRFIPIMIIMKRTIRMNELRLISRGCSGTINQ